MTVAVCSCGVVVKNLTGRGRPRRHCSSRCRFAAHIEAKRQKHFAATIADGFDCKTCGKHFYPNRKKRYCSVECREAVGRVANCEHCGKVFLSRAAKTCSIACAQKHRDQIAPMVNAVCRLCNKTFQRKAHLSRVVYCSTRCRDRTREKGRSSYLNFAARIRRQNIEDNTPPDAERVSPVVVFERDNWACQICGFPVDRQSDKPYDPLAPTIDHIVPVSKGGGHTYKNVRCAHFKCNNRRSDREVC